MIYRNKGRAKDVAAELTEKRGFGLTFYACRIEAGWTVICSYLGAPLGRYGVLEVAE
jgi:hypothetical protein